MSVKLILMEDINKLGKAGEIVNVAPGYARNYLIPQNLALTVSKGAMKQFEAQREKIEAKRQEEIKNKQQLAEKIEELEEITIPVNVSKNDKLYGSVTASTITNEMEKLGVKIDPETIMLEEPIKELGVYDVEIKLHPEVVTKTKIWVVRA